jgi:hypothetical protein
MFLNSRAQITWPTSSHSSGKDIGDRKVWLGYHGHCADMVALHRDEKLKRSGRARGTVTRHSRPRLGSCQGSPPSHFWTHLWFILGREKDKESLLYRSVRGSLGSDTKATTTLNPITAELNQRQLPSGRPIFLAGWRKGGGNETEV